MKMKMSVILGITQVNTISDCCGNVYGLNSAPSCCNAQMMFGLVLKMCNAIHFRQKLDLFCEAIPQVG